MTEYESAVRVESPTTPGVTFTIARMSFGRRVALMRKIRELAARLEFLEAGGSAKEQMDAALLHAEIDRTYLEWGVLAVGGLFLDGEVATATSLAERGPENLCREAVRAVKAQAGLSEAERKN